jgi:Sigma-70 region 2
LARKEQPDLELRPHGTISRLKASKSCHPPVRFPLQFARWLAHNSGDAEDLVQETHLEALRNFASFQSGHQFPRMDVSNTEKYLSKLPLKTLAARDRYDSGREGRT